MLMMPIVKGVLKLGQKAAENQTSFSFE